MDSRIELRAPRARRRACLALACAVSACGYETAPGSSPADTRTQAVRPAAHAGGPGAGTAAERTVTLITGDRVTLTGAPGAPSVHVEPGPGRAQIGFITMRSGDEVTVIPRDVAPLVAGGGIDRALFDVTRLLADGFGDAVRDDLPLIVTGAAASPRAAALATTGGIAVHRAMPALRAVAIRQRKASPGAALAMLQPAAPGVKLWLDRHRRPVLDRSVPQIGAPAAYARGFTGKGAVVAVLDTGIDASHPDLAGVVVDAQSFVDDGLGTSDVVGHATHVASIIAGSGAASSGRFHGVAPDARLISARVCGEQFCDDSAILAGMEWAVTEKHAPIVNLSLGGPDFPGLDPLEDAIDRLSAQYGTLFVVAAGNNGEIRRPEVESPGSAEAALTVGAIDRADQLAVFSSFGPTVDGLIKPDVTAPGVGIVAAMATGLPPLGDPVDTAYQALSGTSMATPHVAGAAAILLQEHPGWTGAQLKAALTSSASPNPALVPFQQGTGRIDVDRATRQQVAAQPASLNIGLARWPHTDDPLVVRTVTYRNDGAGPVTLALTASLALADHRTGPAGMIRVEPATLTVPAGGTADATVTVDTNGDGPDGKYSGAVTATTGDTRVATAIAVEREVESYDLTLRAIDRAGQPASAFIDVVPVRPDGLESGIGGFVTGDATLRLPRDRYSIYAFPPDPVFLAYPRLTLDHDTTVELDERLARPIEVALAGTPLTVDFTEVRTVDLVDRLVIGMGAGAQLFSAQLGPEAPADEFRSVAGVFAIRAGAPADAPQPYAFAHQERGHLLTGWRAVVQPGQLATIEASHVGASHSTFRRFLSPVLADQPQLGPVLFGDFFDYPAIAHRTERVFGAGFLWDTALRQFEADPFEPEVRFAVATIDTARAYRPGQRHVERWNHAPFGPAFADITGRSPATRRGDTLTLQPSVFSDANVPARASDPSFELPPRYTLFRDGVKIAEHINVLERFFAPVEVPAGAATYRFETEQVRGLPVFEIGPPAFELSTHVTAAWTFRSRHEAGARAAILPLPTPRFLPELDEQQAARAGLMLLPVLVDRPQGAARPPVASLRVEISFDDGGTWSPVPGVLSGERWLGLVVNPRHAGFASLRASTTDAEANRGEVTILRAYQIADR
jgi:hypothetical protein